MKSLAPEYVLYLPVPTKWNHSLPMKNLFHGMYLCWRLHGILYWHSGIAGPWTCVLDPEMLDSGPIFPEVAAYMY